MMSIVITLLGLLTSYVLAVITTKLFDWNYIDGIFVISLDALILSVSLFFSFNFLGFRISTYQVLQHALVTFALMFALVFLAPIYAAYASFLGWGLCTLLIYIITLHSINAQMNGWLYFFGMCISGSAFILAFGESKFNLWNATFIWSFPITTLLPLGVRKK